MAMDHSILSWCNVPFDINRLLANRWLAATPFPCAATYRSARFVLAGLWAWNQGRREIAAA